MHRVLTCAIVAGCGTTLSGCDQLRALGPDASRGAIPACETYIASKLAAPSTYKRTEATYALDQPFSAQEFKKYSLTKFCGSGTFWTECGSQNETLAGIGMKLLSDEKGWKHPSSRQVAKIRSLYWQKMFDEYKQWPESQQHPATVIITYDAANAYGTPIRDAEVCKFGPLHATEYTVGDLYKGSVVDGAD